MEQHQATTETESAEAPRDQSSPTWDRPVTGRVIGGVAAGIAERTKVAPWLVRVLFGIAMIADGAGLLLYFVLWLFMPDRSTGRSIIGGTRLELGPIDSPARVAGIVLVVLGATILIPASSVFGRPLLLAIILAGVGVALINSRE